MIEALHFPETTDRNKAGGANFAVVERDPLTYREEILRRAGETLAEMAGLFQPNNSEGARAILTLLAGRDLGEDTHAWTLWLHQWLALRKSFRSDCRTKKPGNESRAPK